MSKDRNTVAKRQREMQKKQKANEKRARHAQKGQNTDEVNESEPSRSSLSAAERKVLGMFRKCLMTPEKVLAFDSSNLETYKTPLAHLASKGLLVAEASPGAYSLTDTGFVAMNNDE